MIRAALTCFLMALMAVAAVAAIDSNSNEEMIVKVETTKPMKLKNTKDAAARFKDMGQSGIQYGMENIRIMGTAKYTGHPDGRTGVNINWHTVKITEDGKSLTQTLGTPLTSSFDVPPKNDAGTPIKRVDPLTSFDAQGNLNELLQIINDLKKKLAEKNKPKQSQEYLAKKGEQTNIAAPAGTSSGSSGSSNPLAWPDTGSITTVDSGSKDSSDDSGSVEALAWDTYQDCPPRLDADEGKVYLQRRGIRVDENNATIDAGVCEDTGEVVTAQKTSVGCSPVVDNAAGKAYVQTKYVAVIDGQDIDVSTCEADMESPLSLQVTTEGCGIRVDFENNKAWVQQKQYYVYDGQLVDAGECEDSSTSYALYTSAEGCTTTYNHETGHAFPQERKAYTNPASGEAVFVSECSPVSAGGYEITERYCDPKYEHNYETGMSYDIKEKVYDFSGETYVVSNCTISTETSYQHLEIMCGYEHNDPGLFSIGKSFTQITTVDEGNMTLIACRNNSNPIPYALTGSLHDNRNFTSDTTWTAPPGLTEVELFLVGGGSPGGDGSGTPGTCTVVPGNEGEGDHGGKGGTGYYSSYYSGMSQMGSNEYYSGGGGAGGDGEVVNGTYVITPGETYQIQIGSGLGTDTSFGSVVSAQGGSGIWGKNASSDESPYSAGAESGTGWNGFGAGGAGGQGGMSAEYRHSGGTTGCNSFISDGGYVALYMGCPNPYSYASCYDYFYGDNGTRKAQPGEDGTPGIIQLQYDMDVYLRVDGSNYTVSGS